MSLIFISHVREDIAIVNEIVNRLEAAGYSTWYFERDALPGTSYLIQVTQAIERCRAIVLLISPRSVGSDQVTKEVVGAFETGIPFFPVLIDMRPSELKQHQPEWRHALGGTTMISIGSEGVSVTITRIIDGLKAIGIQPEAAQAPTLAPEPTVSTPKSYTPKHLADKILAARPGIEGERKQVTVLFADVTGFNSMSGELDPEEIQDLVGQCLDIFTEEIHRYEGTIAQFLGNGVMALFGAPIAHEDAPQRALYAALGIQEQLRDYAEQVKEKGIEFEMRIGLNTGLVVLGRIGEDLTMEYTPMGDTVDMASRMMHIAEPGMIQVAENTYCLTEGYFEFKPLGDVPVKGKKETVRTYQLLRAGPVRTKLGTAIARGLTPFVGRKTELEHLADCFDRVNEGQGQVVGVVGEAGVGKSRLILELRGMLPEEEYTYLEGRCLHYGGSTAFLPILDILRSYFDIEEGEQESTIKQKMEDKITQLDERLKGILPPLHEILSLKVEDENYLKLEPQQKREKTFEAIRDLLIRESQNKPLILAGEDLQWIDKTSEEFLTYLMGWLANAPILLLIAYRPDYTHLWGSKSYYSQVRVDELSTNASAELMQSILGRGEVVPELRELIVSRAGGNPFFIEEFTHALVENGSIKRKDHQYALSTKASEIKVPDTIQGIIAARMDRLEENRKQTMQVASVIGRDFAFRILHTITGMQEELKSYLLDLQGLEFIYEKSLFPELEYIFKHALTQEVAYDSLLLKKRREIHEKVGEAIEELYPDRLEEFYEMLAHHYSRSENSEKAYQYLKLAGNKATRSYSNWEAFRFYKEAINLLKKLSEIEENKRRGIEVRVLIAGPMRALAYPESSLQILEEGERLSEELGDQRSLAKLYAAIGCYYTTRGQTLVSTKYCQNAFREAEKAQDIEIMAPLAFELCVGYNFRGEFLRTTEFAPKVIALLEKTGRESEFSFPPFNTYSSVMAMYGMAIGFLGAFEEGKTLCQKSLRFATEIDDLYSVGYAEGCYGGLFACWGDGENAVEHAQNAVRLCEERQVLVILCVAWAALGQGYYLLGEMETARKHIETALKIQSDAGLSHFLSICYLALSMVHFDSGDLKAAQSCIGEALRWSQNNNEKLIEGQSRVWQGRILSKAEPSQSDKAEEYILQGIKILDELQAKPFCAQGYLCLGEFYADAGQKEKALENLKKAEAMFQEMGMDYWLRQTQSILEKLSKSN
ncbi:MAG: adenylate/guanylate cyclase domain-containing protein [Desulfatiglandales bacterium]